MNDALSTQWLNGELSQLPLNHRGLAFGDGVFETCYASARGIEYLPEHLARLTHGASVLNLNVSQHQIDTLHSQLKEITSTLKTAHVLKIMLLRAASGRGYDFDPLTQTVDVIVQLSAYQQPDWVQTGASVIAIDSPIAEFSRLAGVKHLNRLDSVLARQDARHAKADEALMQNQNGEYIEGSMSNLFIRINDQWHTPPTQSLNVQGVVRAKILSKHPDIHQSRISLTELNQCDSAFICNSLIGVVPVTRLNTRPLAIHPKVSQFMSECFDRD